MKIKTQVFTFLLIITLKFAFSQSEPPQRIDVVDESTKIYSINITNDENLIATGTRSVKIWNPNTGQELFNFTEHGIRDIVSIDFSDNNNLIASGDRAFEAIVWNKNTGDVVQRFEGADREPKSNGILVALTPDNKKLITASNSTLQQWDISNGEELLRYPEIGLISSVLIHPNGKHLFLESGGVVMINIDNGEIERVFVNLRKQSISNNGNIIQGIIELNNGAITIEQYNTNTGELIRSFPLNTDIRPKAIDMSPDGKNFLLGNTVRRNGATEVLNRVLFDAITPGSIRSYTARENATMDSPESEDEIIRYFPNGRKFLTVNGKSIHIWDISDVVTRVGNGNIIGN